MDARSVIHSAGDVMPSPNAEDGMTNPWHTLLIGVVGAATMVIAASPARSDSQPDELVRGQVVVVKTSQLAKFVAKPAPGSVFELPDASNDPAVNGATLQLFDSIYRPDGTLTVSLPAGSNWKRLGSATTVKGYKYKGSGTAGDPCKAVLIKPKVMKAVCTGAGISMTLPVRGYLGVVLTTGTGAKRYCAAFGGTPHGNPAKILHQTNSPAPAACPSSPEPPDCGIDFTTCAGCVQSQPAGVCVGDCKHNQSVDADDEITACQIALGILPLADCPAADANADAQVTHDELCDLCLNALSGCPPP
jgi:hypothetical protein